MLGINTAKEYRPLTNPGPVAGSLRLAATSIALRTMVIMVLIRINIQYSFRLARPENTAYFFSTSIYQFITIPRQ